MTGEVTIENDGSGDLDGYSFSGRVNKLANCSSTRFLKRIAGSQESQIPMPHKGPEKHQTYLLSLEYTGNGAPLS